MQVKDYMQAITMTVFPHDLLSTAAQRMHALFIRHLPVITADKELVGIISDRDIRQANSSGWLAMTAQAHPQLHTLTVQQVMTTHVHSVHPDTAMVEAGALLLEHKFDGLPVVHADGKLAGIITATDFIRAYIQVGHHIIEAYEIGAGGERPSYEVRDRGARTSPE